MKATDSLFVLIKSLTGPEKGYFKKFASLHVKGETNNYIKLFEAINECNEYDENSIKKSFSEQSFVKYFANEKNYLYNLILKSLRNYHSGVSTEEDILERIGNATILFRKGLYKEALIAFGKAKKIAFETGKYPLVLTVNRFEGIILQISQSPDQLKKLKELNREETRILQIIEWIKRWRLTINDLYAFHTKNGYAVNQQDFNYLNSLMNDTFLKQADPSLERYTLQLEVLHAFIARDSKKAYLLGERFVSVVTKLFKKQKHYFDYHLFHLYIVALGNFLSTQIEMRKYKEAIITIGRLKELQKNQFISRSKSLQSLLFAPCSRELNIYSAMGNYTAGLNALQSIKTDLEKYQDSIGLADKLHCLFLFVNIYFGAEKYDQALVCINQILSHKRKEIREDLYTLAIILNMIIHFELKNDDLLSSLSRSMYRNLHKKKKSLKFETIILRFIQKNLLTSLTQKDFIQNLKDLKKKLFILMDDPFERIVLLDFDFISWAESKIENRPFAEIVKRNANK